MNNSAVKTIPKILKDGKENEILPNEIRKGDILCLESGAVICCDCKIISGRAEINESVLTGESEPMLNQYGFESRLPILRL